MDGESEVSMKMYITNDKHTSEKWEELVDQLKRSRYFIDKNLKVFDFIRDMNESSINPGEIFYRARMGTYIRPEDLGAPPSDRVTGGRLNPRAISYLYVASELETAISEIRPWIGASVSLAKCVPQVQMRIKDFTLNGGSPGAVNDFKRVINNLFATKVDPSNNELEYLATQAVAEYIREQGYDGVKYFSSTHETGINLTVFDPGKMTIEYEGQTIISSISYFYSKITK